MPLSESRLLIAAPIAVCIALAAACDSTPTALAARAVPSRLTLASASRLELTFLAGDVDTTTWTVRLGGAANFAAVAYDSSNNKFAVSGAVYHSSDDSVLAVDSTTGQLLAVHLGAASVVATVNGISGSSPVITVVDTVAPPPDSTPAPPDSTPAPPDSTATPPQPSPDSTFVAPGSGQVALMVQRFDGGSGVVTVSNGIPLTKGLANESNLGQFHVRVNGAEQAVYVRPLAGHFKDGSLRAVLVQFDYDVPASGAIPATLVIGGGPRTQPDLAARPTQQVPAAAALPTDPNYLAASRWGGVLYAARPPAPSVLAAQFDADYARLEAADWSKCGPRWGCNRTAGYDRAYILYQAWQRTANPTYWYHATAAAADYVKGYIVPSGAPTAWWAQSEGMAVHYWATGDEMSRYQLRKMAEMLAWMVRPGFSAYIGGTYGDDRFRAKAMMAALDAAMLEISTQPADAGNYYKSVGAANTYYASYLTPSTLGTWVTAVLGTQRTDGQFGGRYYSYGTWSPDSGGQSNYMVGMLLSALIRYYEEVTPDPRIPDAVKKCIDDMWTREWEPSQLAFEYHSLRGTDEGAKVAAHPNPEPGLNGFMAHPFAWYARVTGDGSYDAKVDQILAGLAQPVSRNWWASSPKAFDEAFSHLFNTLAYRAGLR
ncbi:hypothetical protein J421_2485 [Gemmatirosa kalamazoonensis]|uniref:Uncharacterized protein n=1 Tax=Gemmatirosa kalamazoonensis TaxID=861299 RepID=W0RHW7_9BACT|nr:Ig-like domain-containing protein [Gemmatirosa kalamazoonensis]AHG90022.1 hypothetical protein J421_2485 [Gemmatirosa kalamazoonensis]